MKLIDCMKPTSVIDENMTVRDALKECVTHEVPGLPFVDKDGNITGRFSIRNMFYTSCIPADLIKNAHLLGNDIEHLDIPDSEHLEFLNKPAKAIVVEWIVHLTPEAQAVKALALMEHFDTPYLFVVDSDDKYLGIVTSMNIAAKLLDEK